MLADDCLLFFVECKKAAGVGKGPLRMGESVQTVDAVIICLLYTSDAADD